MKKLWACAALAGSSLLWDAQAGPSTFPPELGAALPLAKLAGQASLSVWGFEVYQASLWVAPGFAAASYPQHAFAIELSYLRSFRGQDIAQRSIAEMRRLAPIDAQDEQRWEGRMRALFPDVKPGDRITGIHQPGRGALFLGMGRVLGEIRDPEFARLFFGIWLAPQTSEPALRLALLSLLAPAPTP
ncbi:MAG: chalcone isomerase family protein [Rhodoferax sp.]